jgi:hypothetical protein
VAGSAREAYRSGMRLPGIRQDCGALLELGWVTRQLRLSQPIDDGSETIQVAQIVGTVNRGRDFDACWQPLQQRMARQIAEIERTNPVGMDEPIDVIRVDRAFFVVDGHKRVALARRTGREFLDARVNRLQTPYELTPDVDRDAIVRTAREAEFRRHSGMAEAVPEARFALTEMDDYGELLEAVQSHAYAMTERDQRFVPPVEAAADWYRSVYLPTVAEGRSAVSELIRACSDADAFLLVHRQRLAYWGTECDAPGCAGEKLAATPVREGPLPRLSRILGRRTPDSAAPRLLPLADGEPSHTGDGEDAS